MKFVKKITALFLALTMVMAMGITASAATTEYTISVGQGDTHTYTVYQVFTGDTKSGSLEITDIAAGKQFKTANGQGDNGANLSAAEAAEKIAALSGTEQEKAKEIAKFVDTSSNMGTVSASNPLRVQNGYYFIVDTTETLGEGESYNAYVVRVLNGDITINTKRDTVKFEKKLRDINDTTDADYGELQDSADYDIGDDVPFELKATLPNNVTSYDTYYVQFKDQMEKGLSLNADSIEVYVGSTKLDASKYTVDAQATLADDGSIDKTSATAFTVTIADVKKLGVTSINSAVITVKYTAKLTESANIGSAGNINEAKLVYSNKPDQSQGGDTHSETPWDNVIVFTYKVVVDKTDAATKQPLTGATFKLEKKLYSAGEEKWEEIKSVTINNEKTKFTFSGLDDGTYKLTETVTPKGYKTIDPITFTVTAQHTFDFGSGNASRNADNEAIYNNAVILESLTGTAASGEITFTANTKDGSLSTTVENSSGASLPETGGMGTTVLYIAGIAMIVAAGIVVIARKRNA